MPLIRLLPALMICCAAATASEPHPGADDFITETAREYQLDPEQVRAWLEEARYQASIIDAITRPAESRPWHEYRQIFLTETRAAAGAEFWRANAGLIADIEAEFNIPGRIVVAIVGVETNYGMLTGGYRVLDALATLGFYYPRRGGFFARELGQFMALAREESLPVTEIKGSYAGAMGLGQFIPSSYRAYAVDFDDDGVRDLWRSLPDALASVANYFRAHHWQPGQPAVLEADISAADDIPDMDMKPAHTLAELARMGVRFDAGDLPADTPATLIELDGAEGPEHWVGLQNFYVITRYNRSPLYAMAVIQLSEAIAERQAP